MSNDIKLTDDHIKLGSEVEDIITGFVGFATHKLEYLDGHTEIGITPRSENGQTPTSQVYIPVYRLKLTGNSIDRPMKRNKIMLGFCGPDNKGDEK